MISTFLFYTVVASSVLFYGIGINRTVFIQKRLPGIVMTCFKALFSSAATTMLSYMLSNAILVPLHLEELFPLMTLFIFILFSQLVEIFVGIGLNKVSAEFVIPLLSSILGLRESFSIGSAVLISCSSIISFYLLTGIFYAVQDRVSFYTTKKGLNMYYVLLLCLAILIITITGLNASWLYVSLEGGF